MKLAKAALILAVLGSFAVANVVMAEGQEKAESKKSEKKVDTVTVTGSVSVQKDAKGEIKGVELTTADAVVYSVRMNAEGKALAKEDGKKVEATGVVSEKEGKKVLHVASFKPAS